MKRNSGIKYLAQLLFLTFSCFFIFHAHGSVINTNENKPIPTSSIAVASPIVALHFMETADPSLNVEAYVLKGKYNLFYVTVPLSLTTNEVNLQILSTRNSTVKVNGVEAATSVGIWNEEEVAISLVTINIENTITVEVTAASGAKYSYDILVQKGIQALDSIIYAFKEKYNIPGVSFAIANVDSTRTAYQAGYGFSIQEDKKRVLPSDLFRLASMSKQHTAIAILKLIEEGNFGIDDFVFGPNGILKDKFPIVPNKAARITVRNLLEHTSGYSTYPDYMFNKLYTGWSMEQRIRAMLSSRQPNEPGAVFAYYNTGYGILGYIIETISGKTYAQYLSDLYATVGVYDIQVGGTQAERRWNEVAYYGQNEVNAEGLDMNVRAAAGGLIASTEQLIKLMWALDGKPNIPDILSPASREMMFTPSKTGKSRYALGWRTNHNFFPDSFYHGGTLAGVATFWVYAEGYAVIFLCNSRSNIRRFDDEFYIMARDILAKAKELNL